MNENWIKLCRESLVVVWCLFFLLFFPTWYEGEDLKGTRRAMNNGKFIYVHKKWILKLIKSCNVPAMFCGELWTKELGIVVRGRQRVDPLQYWKQANHTIWNWMLSNVRHDNQCAVLDTCCIVDWSCGECVLVWKEDSERGSKAMNGCLSKLKWIVVCLQKASINDFAAHNNFSAIVYWQSPLLIWWTRESRDSDSRRGQNLSQISKNYRLSRNKLGALIGINRVTRSECCHR